MTPSVESDEDDFVTKLLFHLRENEARLRDGSPLRSFKIEIISLASKSKRLCCSLWKQYFALSCSEAIVSSF